MTDLAATQAFYGRWARLYDLIASAPGISSWREQAAASLHLSPGDTVLEVGCGTGANFPHLRERVGPTGRIFGIDLVPGMLARANERIERAGWSNVHVCQADATRPPVDGPFDAILSTFVIGMLDDPAGAVTDWVALLAPGGHLALLNATRSDHPLAAPINVGFRAFVRIVAPGRRTRPESVVEELEAKNEAGRAALAEATTVRTDAEFAGGYVWLVTGARGE